MQTCFLSGPSQAQLLSTLKNIQSGRLNVADVSRMLSLSKATADQAKQAAKPQGGAGPFIAPGTGNTVPQLFSPGPTGRIDTISSPPAGSAAKVSTPAATGGIPLWVILSAAGVGVFLFIRYRKKKGERK